VRELQDVLNAEVNGDAHARALALALASSIAAGEMSTARTLNFCLRQVDRVVTGAGAQVDGTPNRDLAGLDEANKIGVGAARVPGELVRGGLAVDGVPRTVLDQKTLAGSDGAWDIVAISITALV